jgi:hypothetical protein
MAGDWIKMRCDLFTHPKVVRISSALKADKLRTVGGLMSAWSLFDAHSIDGTLEGYTSATLDDHLGWQGFSAAMIAVGWLVDTGESLELPRFDAHNGQSAKRRAQENDRKKEARKMSADDADKKRTREEKRREEKEVEEKRSLRFAEFWDAYPRKIGKEAALKAFSKVDPTDDLLQTMLRALASAKQSQAWLKDGGGYIPHASTWLNGKRWEDELVTVTDGAQPWER